MNALRSNPLLPLSLLLMAVGLAVPYALLAGLALAALWFALTALGVMAGPDAAPVLLAGIIGTVLAAWFIL